MDPISVSASIIAILQLTATVIKYLNEVKSVSEDRQMLMTEITNTTGFLYLLKSSAEDSQVDSTTLHALSLLNASDGLNQFKSSLEELALILRPGRGVQKAAKSLAWPFLKGQIKEILVKIERQKSLFGLALQNDTLGLSRAIKKDIIDLQDQTQDIGAGIAQLKLSQNEKEKKEILEWISPLNFWARQKDISQKREAHTGDWLLQTEEFKTWFGGSRMMLWCLGAPGSGKTVLASLVINQLENEFQTTDIGLAYIYCSYQDKDQTLINLVSSLVQQLLHKLQDIPESIVSLYNNHTKKNTRPTRSEFAAALDAVVGEFSKTYIVIDALDECPESDGTRQALLNQLQELSHDINTLITSRPAFSIRGDTERTSYLEIRAKDEDIMKYLEGRMRSEQRLRRHVSTDASLKTHIIATLVQKSQGIFLLAQLHADSLAKKQSRRDIRVALQNLPNELKGTYDEVLRRINNQDIEDAGLAKRVLSWLSCALIPLRVVELQHALAITENDLSIDEEAFIDEELLVSVCCGMVIVDPGSDIIQLVHTTAQEYLDLTRQEQIPDAHTIIARSCLLYLSSDTIIDQVPENYEEQELRLQTFPFINYSSRCWGIHLQISSDQECEELAFNILKDDVKLLPAGHFLYTWHQGKAGNYQGTFQRTTSCRELWLNDNEKTPLYIALSYNYDLLAEYLISLPGLDIHAGRKTRAGSILHAAAGFGNVRIAKVLIEKGADIEILKNRGLTPLHVAAENGCIDMIRFLLQAGSDAHKTSNSGATPLYRAARSGSIGSVEILLAAGSDVNALTWDGWTPIYEAIQSAHIGVLIVLLAAGANLQMTNLYGFSPFTFAQYYGRHEMVAIMSKAQEQRALRESFES